jgi:hypothetical protein
LPVGRYRLNFAAAAPVRFTDFPGSAWRGALGHALKRIACVTRERSCPACLLYRSCAYSYVFETPPPLTAAKMRRYSNVPHPFALRVESGGDTERCTLWLTLFGSGNRHLALFIYALMRAGEGERGISGNRLTLEGVAQETEPGRGEWQTIYEPAGLLEPLPAAVPSHRRRTAARWRSRPLCG